MTDEMIKFLKDLISFKSISAEKEMADVSLKTAEFIKMKLSGLGAEIKIVENEIRGNNPLILGRLGNDIKKKTILLYSHYDVQPASLDDGWKTEPFVMIEKDDGYLYGRGTNDDKGPITASYFAVKELLAVGELPVNLRWLYEGEEESSSGGFEDTVLKHIEYFGDVNGLLILDTSWFGDKTPSMDYGFRGMVYMGISITGPKADQHSGLVGGTIREPMHDLSILLTKLVDLNGKIMIDGFYDSVLPLTDEEVKLYENIEFNLEDYKNYLGVDRVISEDANTVLMNQWRYPSISIHGIQGAFHGFGAKTVVPGTVIGKVSVRIVPNQTPDEIEELFKIYLSKEFEKLDSPNKLDLYSIGKGDWWYGDVNNFLFKAGEEAIKEYWGMDPSYARSGGSIPIIPFMEKIFSAPAIGLGIGQSTDGAHSQNERIRVKNLVGGKEVIKLLLQKLKI